MLAGWVALWVAVTPAPSPRCVQIVGTNDLHGHIAPDARQTKPTAPGQPSLTVEQGGLADLAGYLDILQHKFPKQLLLLDGGDLFQGTVPSNLSKGAAVI